MIALATRRPVGEVRPRLSLSVSPSDAHGGTDHGTFHARAEALPFAALTPMRNDPRARLEACAAWLRCPPAFLAVQLDACPRCRAFVVLGEVA